MRAIYYRPMTELAAGTGRPAPLTRNQIRGFWAAWGGWALDGMDSFIYSLVLVPALTELLPRSGIEATPGNIGFYGSVLFALFLIGWGLSMMWGPIADRFGRVRTLTLTILCYSVFTFLGALATSIWQLAIFRLLAGIGIGGEWSMGGTFVAEEWPENRRAKGAGYMHWATTGASSFCDVLVDSWNSRRSPAVLRRSRGSYSPNSDASRSKWCPRRSSFSDVNSVPNCLAG